jgi:acetyl esterase/lipase
MDILDLQTCESLRLHSVDAMRDSRLLDVANIRIEGYSQIIPLRVYRRTDVKQDVPVLLYFHGGGFTRGSVLQADYAARHFAQHTPALVISVGYSLAPKFPFPAAPEDAWRAAEWARKHARIYGADERKIAVAGYDAGGSIANGLTLIARDRGLHIEAQALFAPMLDPSLSRLGDEHLLASDITSSDCAQSYRAYLPKIAQRMHPYAAPIESTRLVGLPATFIATAQNDILHVEAEQYASRLIDAGVATQVTRFPSISHVPLADDSAALWEGVRFFRCRFGRLS